METRETSHGSPVDPVAEARPGARAGSGGAPSPRRLSTGWFVRELAQDLSSSLTPLAGYQQLLSSGRLGALSSRQAQVLAAMTAAVARLERGVEQLTDWAAFFDGDGASAFERCDLSVLAGQALQSVEPLALSRHVKVEGRIEGGVPVLADCRRLGHVMEGLLTQAVRSSPHGGDVLLELARGDGQVRCDLFDQGGGWDASPTRPDQRGGVALVLARQVVESHGGRLSVDCPPREQPQSRVVYSGTHVRLLLPVAASDRPTPES